MLKINSYFKPLTREQKEHVELTRQQDARARQEVKNKAVEVANSVIEIVNLIQEDKDVEEKIDLPVGDVVRKAFDHMMANDLEPVVVSTSSTQMQKGTKRPKYQRPDNWKDIIDHYHTWGNRPRITMKHFALNGKSVDYWTKTFSRWSKDVQNKKEVSYSGRCSIIGCEMDEELASIVREYNKHGIPMTDLILRCALIGLMKKNNRNDLLEKMISDEAENDIKNSKLRFGRRWCHRFYKRHNFSNRRGTTKMREEFPKDYELKKDNFILHLSKAIVENRVPDELIVGGDETNTQFVPTIKKTRCAAGTR